MNDDLRYREPYRDDQAANLRRLAASDELEPASDSAPTGGFFARLRETWNGAAARRYMRPLVEQQAGFNRALVNWLEQPPGLLELDLGLIGQDRETMRLINNIGTLEARAAVVQGHRLVGRSLPTSTPRRLRIAYFSPLPPDRSGIADYSVVLLSCLAELADITVFSDDATQARSFGLPVKPSGDYPRLRQSFDLPLYQMGNNALHESMYDMLLRYPGVVVLHDYFLHHFVRHHTTGRGDWVGYGREMAYSLDDGGRRLARAIHEGRAEAPLFDQPLNKRLLDASLGLIVHSRFAAERALAQRLDLPLAIVPALVEDHSGHSLRARLALPDDAVLFGSFGQITAEKGIDLALQALQRARRNNPDVHYLLVGEVRPDVDLPALIAAYELEDAVHQVGFVADLAEFVDWIHTADVVVNLRQPTVGETSAVALRAMAAARPLVVFDHGWYSELPGEAAMKTPPGDVDALQATMERLAVSAGERRAMGAAGLDYVRRNCQPEHVARAYNDFLHTIVESIARE